MVFTVNRKIRTLQGITGIVILLSGIFATIGLYILAASTWPYLYYWPHYWPETQLTPGQIAVPIVIIVLISTLVFFSLVCIRLLCNKQIRRSLKIFTNIWVIFMIVVGSWSFTLSTPEIQYWAYDAGPYLTWANNQDPSNSITVCWHSKWITGSKVGYGLTPYNMENTATSSEFDRYHKVPISDLIPNTTYYYEVIGFGIKEFTTAPIGGHNYTFSVWSDPRTNGNIDNALKGANLPEIMHNQLISDNIKLAFSINAGDITHRGVDYRTWQLWLKDISTNDFASNASHQIAIGNHERHDDWGMRYFSLYYPYKNTSYSFDYGNVHFSFLDRLTSNYPWYRGDGAQHAKWLEEDLISHSESKFKVLVMHNNPLRFDLDNGNNILIMEVAKNYGVDVIFTGHNHEYETKYLNGTDIETAGSINYVENIVMMIGIGGNSLDPTYAGYCRIDVTEDSMTLRPYWVNGTQIENPFVIQKL